MEKGMEKRKGLELRHSDAERGNQQRGLEGKKDQEGRGRPGECGQGSGPIGHWKEENHGNCSEEMRAWARLMTEGPGGRGPVRCYHPSVTLEETKAQRGKAQASCLRSNCLKEVESAAMNLAEQYLHSQKYVNSEVYLAIACDVSTLEG